MMMMMMKMMLMMMGALRMMMMMMMMMWPSGQRDFISVCEWMGCLSCLCVGAMLGRLREGLQLLRVQSEEG
jgi:hypothetical protein